MQKDESPAVTGLPQTTQPETAAESCEHHPRKRDHVLDPVSAVANTANGDSTQHLVFYFCDCGKLNKVTPAAFQRAA
jgi:hypothetical protein